MDREPPHALQIQLAGAVQGFGVRPAVARLARELGLAGRVRNDAHGVVIELEGERRAVERFTGELRARLPSGVCLESVRQRTGQRVGLASFEIEGNGQANRLGTRIPADRNVCEACLSEVRSPHDRRFRFAFNSCLECGPRYSIIRRMPYERAETAMSDFVMCAACRREYEQATSRRFHAQTIACPQCGPRLWYSDVLREPPGTNGGFKVGSAATGDAIGAAADMIERGGIVAVKGVGGYQLVCDATVESAVDRLRRLKRRLAKPLAVMVSGLQQASQLACLDDAERAALSSPAGPIVLVRAARGNVLAPGVNPGLNEIGLMLPTTSLHQLLLDDVRKPLVVTSGNVDGEPLVYRTDQAEQRLGPIADGFLHHDRVIERPIDDSVVRLIAGRRVTLRAGRGLAPLALDLPAGAEVLAVGGHQKVALAVSNGHQSLLCPHIGDLETIATRERFLESVAATGVLVGCRPQRIVIDAHPDFFSGVWAAEQDAEVVRAQHHHAHIVAGLVEAGWTDREVLGFSFDGTGWGTDGTIWGGELLRTTVGHAQRIGHLLPIPLVGGEAAVRAPWRIAAAMLQAACGDETRAIMGQLNFDVKAWELLRPLLDRPQFAPRASSMGRLFDGVAAVVLGITETQYEGQPAMQLESACDLRFPGTYDLTMHEGDPFCFDWRPLIRQLIRDRDAGVAAGAMSARFHRALAALVVQAAANYPRLPVVLGGGVFQNRVLVELIVEGLKNHPAPIGLPGDIPPGDGGLAVGQLAIGWQPDRARVDGRLGSQGDIEHPRDVFGSALDKT